MRKRFRQRRRKRRRRHGEGKGGKDRYSLLSERLRRELRAYWKLERSPLWLFPGEDMSVPMSSSTAANIYQKAKRDAGIRKEGARINYCGRRPRLILCSSRV